MQGYLSKKGNLQWKQRWFELHGNVIVYFKSQGTCVSAARDSNERAFPPLTRSQRTTP
jgi:hypothetical protein